jgi:hypothetical protein
LLHVGQYTLYLKTEPFIESDRAGVMAEHPEFHALQAPDVEGDLQHFFQDASTQPTATGLRGNQRPPQFGGALATTLALFTGSALLGHGTVRLPKGLMQGMGTRTGGSGGGTGGIPGNSLSSVGFRTDVVSTAFFALL